MKSVSKKDIPVFITEPPFTSLEQKSILAEILFENECNNIFFGV